MPLPLLIPSPGSGSGDCLPPASVTGTARYTEVLKVLDVRGVNLLFNNGYSLAFCNLSSHLRNPSGVSWDPRPRMVDQVSLWLRLPWIWVTHVALVTSA